MTPILHRLLALISPRPWPGLPAHPRTMADALVALHAAKEAGR